MRPHRSQSRRRLPPRVSDEDSADEVMTAAVRLLARREHSREELRRKLRQREFASGLIDTALDRAADAGYQCDVRYAEQYARARAGRARGPLRIRDELSRRGVDEAVTDRALGDLSVDWFELARSARRKRFGYNAPVDAKDRARQHRFLRGRGFSSDQVRHALNADEGDSS